MNQRLPLCPYGKLLQAFQTESIKLNFPVYIFVGKDAKQTAYENKCLGVLSSYIPQGTDCCDFHWPVKGQKIILFDTGSTSIESIKKYALELLDQGSKSVFIYSESFPLELFTQD